MPKTHNTVLPDGEKIRRLRIQLGLTQEGLAADTEMLEAICEKSSEQWSASLTDITNAAVTVPPEVLAKYVGVYSGLYGGRPRTFDITLQGGTLIAKITGDAIEGGLGATGLDEGAPRTLVPQSQTVFEGLGLGFRFMVDGTGVASDLVVIHISGPYTYHRVR